MQTKKAHFIGIGGIGMSATAKLLKDLGWKISGSDSDFYPPVNALLKSYDISFELGYRKENIPDDVDIIVIGKNVKLIPEDNEEVRAAFKSGVSIRSFPEMLGELTKETKNIIVAGSWGKSTAAALMSWCLLSADKDPSYFVGAVPHNMKESAHLGKEKTFVLEGDEYPSANWDSTSKFLHYNPSDVLLTSAEHDHINVFPSHESYLVPFRTLLSLIPNDGLLVACADEKHAQKLAKEFKGRSVTYGLESGAEWSASKIYYGEISTFDLVNNRKKIISLKTHLLGKHNIQNIIGVAALLLEKKLLTPEELARGVASFQGIARRLDLKTSASSVLVYEGFGSSYEKARAALSAMHLHFRERPLLVVFEPYEFSWRNKKTIHWYDSVFEEATAVLVYKPATQGADTHQQLTQEEIVNRIEQSGTLSISIKNEQEGIEVLKKKLSPDAVVLLMTSGNLGGLIKSIPKLVEKLFPK